MKAIASQPNLVEKVKKALLEEIISGKLKPGERIIQEQVAGALGVSRQPVQQALLLLKNQGVLKEAQGHRLVVTSLDSDRVEDIYEMRIAIEGMACRLAAKLSSVQARKTGFTILEAGRKAVASGSVQKMIVADIKFHEFLYFLSGNPLIAPAMNNHLTYTQRVMGEVLKHIKEPGYIWSEHEDILEAVVRGEQSLAEKLAVDHLKQASKLMVSRLKAIQASKSKKF
jgi:DNA-binding GntR family transcriptional regulator